MNELTQQQQTRSLLQRHAFNLVLFSLLVFGSLLSARDDVMNKSETFSVGGDPVLELENVSGDINITAGDSDKIEVKFFKNDNDIEVRSSQTGDRVTIKVHYPSSFFGSKGDVDFEIRFPEDGKLTIHSVSGSVKVEGVNGDLGLKSVSGNVIARDLEGDLALNRVSGKVEMYNLGTAKIDAASISGKVIYEGGSLKGGDYSFSSTSGSVVVRHSADAAYHVSGRTISGNIRNNVGGDIEVHKEKYTNMRSLGGSYNGNGVALRLNTVSGSITLDVD